jgi:predicted RND superfamily exporter protein
MKSAPSSRPELGGRHRFLLRLEKFSRGRYAWVFAVALVVAVAGAVLGSRLTVDSDILALIPAGNRQVDDFKEAVAEFGSISYLVVLLGAGEHAGPDEIEDFADILAEELLELDDLIELVEHRLDPGADFLDLFYGNALLYLHPDRLPDLVAKLDSDAILDQIRQNRLSLSSPTATFTREAMVNDPLNLMPLLFTPSGSLGNLRIDLTDGYYLSRDGQSLIMLIKPTGSWQDLDFDVRLMQAVREVERRARDRLEREARKAGSDVPEIVLRYTGRYAIAVDEAGLVRKDIKFNLLFSLGAVSALYWLCYRRFAALLYSSVPLLVGQAMTFGLAFFLLPWVSGSRGLNAASSAFTALLMGLGTDFVIVMYARYVEERRLGRTLAEATELMVGETGLGVFTGAITSAGTFYAMCISEFRGLRDLGFLIGSGILLCAIAIVFLVPAMIKWNEGVRKRKVESVKKLYVQSFLAEQLIPFSARYRWVVILVVITLTAASAYVSVSGFLIPGWPTLEFDDTVQVLRSERSTAYQAQQEMADKFGTSLSYMMAVVDAATETEAIALTEAIEQRLQPYLENGTVASCNSILSYLPAASRQQAILAARDAGKDGAFDTARIRETFLRGLDENGFEVAPFAPFVDRMSRFLDPERPIGLADLERHGLDSLIGRYVRRHADGMRIVTYLSMSDPRWKREPPPGLVDDLTGGDERIVITGTNVVSREFRRIFSKEAPRAVALGLVVVFVLLLVDFRSLRLTSIALGQLVCGVMLMLGVMKLADIHLNYVNAFVATMILGVGIDYSIHLVHRMSLTGGAVDSGLLETGKAVVIAALTNIAAFGTLTLGSYPALRSFGQVALIGSLTCLFTALTLVPAVMARRGGRVA